VKTPVILVGLIETRDQHSCRKMHVFEHFAPVIQAFLIFSRPGMHPGKILYSKIGGKDLNNNIKHIEGGRGVSSGVGKYLARA
jgi:hypothetical protein